jgi:hypothetical protein
MIHQLKELMHEDLKLGSHQTQWNSHTKQRMDTTYPVLSHVLLLFQGLLFSVHASNYLVRQTVTRNDAENAEQNLICGISAEPNEWRKRKRSASGTGLFQFNNHGMPNRTLSLTLHTVRPMVLFLPVRSVITCTPIVVGSGEEPSSRRGS